MYDDDDLLPLSGLQHLTYCERRFALVHIECLWDENVFTAEGRAIHERAHSAEMESRPGTLIRRSLPLRSYRLGLSGQADIVEFTPVDNRGEGIPVAGRSGYWRPFPIEYKRRNNRERSDAYQVQLCAQAICLEEMLGTAIPAGAVYDGTSRRRSGVAFTPELRGRVETAAVRMHELFRSRVTPPPILGKKCEKCSLQDACQPGALTRWRSVSAYAASAIQKVGA